MRFTLPGALKTLGSPPYACTCLSTSADKSIRILVTESVYNLAPAGVISPIGFGFCMIKTNKDKLLTLAFQGQVVPAHVVRTYQAT